MNFMNHKLTRRDKAVLEVLADIVSFFISFLVSSLLLLSPMGSVLAGGCVLMMVIAIILLFCFHYYNVKL